MFDWIHVSTLDACLGEEEEEEGGGARRSQRRRFLQATIAPAFVNGLPSMFVLPLISRDSNALLAVRDARLLSCNQLAAGTVIVP
ncbi:hypothetical protein CBR_g9142 [Chara braunii]|uniref:Uncharacterized protein n=1 Tax=Chara braunii TaxID=69332 RepID=A0A388KNW2_CHABU|nr:hypothetical protein CBR_g9142 [Chara braunii]|eukprot:GBG71732.1 hypothetical protein CBR_g9142 [Chara braunii]